MNKREKLLELAKRCKAGDHPTHNEFAELFDIAERKAKHILCKPSVYLDAVAALERELLPHYMMQLSYSPAAGYHCIFQSWRGLHDPIEVRAKTEPLARLAALLKALAEMEKL